MLLETDYTAVVVAADGVRFVATAPSSEALSAKLALYVQRRCDDRLWPAEAGEVHSLIAEGRADDAIATYFGKVGARWDDEHLHRSDGDRP